MFVAVLAVAAYGMSLSCDEAGKNRFGAAVWANVNEGSWKIARDIFVKTCSKAEDVEGCVERTDTLFSARDSEKSFTQTADVCDFVRDSEVLSKKLETSADEHEPIHHPEVLKHLQAKKRRVSPIAVDILLANIKQLRRIEGTKFHLSKSELLSLIYRSQILARPVKAKTGKEIEEEATKKTTEVNFLAKKATFDPHCAKGLIDGPMTVCCQPDCGECHDNSNVCKKKDVNGRGTTCCPTVMLGEKLPSCEFSHAPCFIPDFVRNPPSIADLTSATVHAKDDCNEAIPAKDADFLLNTHFMKFTGKGKTSATVTTQCSTYGFDTAAASQCNNLVDCVGFTVGIGTTTPSCLLVAGTELETLSTSTTQDTWLKHEELSGAAFQFTATEWGACSEKCGGGTMTRTVSCQSTHGVSVTYGMCSSLAAINADSIPAATGKCNMFNCSYEMTNNMTAHHDGTVTLLSVEEHLIEAVVADLKGKDSEIGAAVEEAIDAVENPHEYEELEFDRFSYAFTWRTGEISVNPDKLNHVIGEKGAVLFEEQGTYGQDVAVSTPEECFPAPPGTTHVIARANYWKNNFMMPDKTCEEQAESDSISAFECIYYSSPVEANGKEASKYKLTDALNEGILSFNGESRMETCKGFGHVMYIAEGLKMTECPPERWAGRCCKEGEVVHAEMNVCVPEKSEASE